MTGLETWRYIVGGLLLAPMVLVALALVFLVVMLALDGGSVPAYREHCLCEPGAGVWPTCPLHGERDQ